jgi:hypothetical protein
MDHPRRVMPVLLCTLHLLAGGCSVTDTMRDAAEAQLIMLCGALDRFEYETGRPLSSTEDLNVLAQPHGEARLGPWLRERSLIDPWGNRIRYRAPTASAAAQVAIVPPAGDVICRECAGARAR